MSIFLTSDFHFSHDKDFVYTSRGFSSVAAMNEELIHKFNSVVTATDDVYVLGDLLLMNNKTGLSCVRRLNGRLHIVRGNHDTDVRMRDYEKLPNVVEICGWATTLKYKKFTFYLCHFPTLTANYDIEKPLKRRTINLCGHSHTTDKFADMDKGTIYHCEVDAHDGYPVSLDKIIADLKEYYGND